MKERELTKYPEIISYECTKKIMDQMQKNICKIEIDDKKGTGFFCKIPFPTKDKMLNIFITSNHIINKETLFHKSQIMITIEEEKKHKKINLINRKKYTNKEYDITIIEIKEEDEISNYLELDENIMKKEEINYILIIQYI